MKFFCEYCGFRIDANEDDKCPNCGASYKKNKTFLKLEEEKKKQEEQSNKLKEEVIKTTLNGFKFRRWFMIFPIAVFIIILVIFIINFTSMPKTNNLKNRTNEIDNQFNEIKEELEKNKEPEEKKIESVTVTGLNNYGSIDEYEFMVTGYEVVTSKWKDDYKNGNECVKFYFQVKNTSNKQISREDVNCIVDGVAQNKSTFGSNTMTYWIGKDLTVKGDIEFMVPKNATSYDIKYGDYITVHIEKN